MKKFFVSLLVLLFPVLASAQAPQKIAIVDTQAILMAMPETKSMQTELEKLQKTYADTIETMKQELQKKYEEYVAQKDSMIETIKQRKLQDVEDIQKRIDDLVNVASEELQKKQQQLITPIQQKVKKAIEQVGNENGYAYIVEAQFMIYVGSNGINATDLVRTKLGLK